MLIEGILWNQGFAGKHRQSALGRGSDGDEEGLICRISQFPCCKYFHCDRFHATNARLLHVELGSIIFLPHS